MSDYFLFGTAGCHLCEQAEQLIEHSEAALAYHKQDIVEKNDWMEQYATRIPVLYHIPSREELGWPFDQTSLQQFISRHRRS